MAKIEYDFDHDKVEKSRAGLYFRLGGIFLFVAGLTAGIIWLLIPKSAAGKAGNPPPKTVESAPAEEKPEAPSAVSGKTPKAGESALPVDTGASTSASTPAPAPVAETEPLAPEEKPTILPEKDKPWVGDPVVDLPEVPKADIPVVARPALDADFDKAGQAAKVKNHPEAVAAAEKIFASGVVTAYSPEWRRAAKLLTDAHLAEFRDREAVEGETKWYTVKPGDSYSRVAARFHTTIDAIRHYNRIAENDNILRVSRRLLLLPGPWKIVIRKQARLLELFRNGRLYAAFDVGLGRFGKTPVGNFVISSKLKNPDWYAPGGGIVRYGDPDNPLGNRFLKLAPKDSPNRPLLGYGIHGTRDDSNITRSLSNGCVRMRNADVENLYLIVPARTPVEIVE